MAEHVHVHPPEELTEDSEAQTSKMRIAVLGLATVFLAFGVVEVLGAGALISADGRSGQVPR